MIYVIGVHHREEQFSHWMNIKEKVERLQSFLPKFCKEKGIQLIAEEWRDEVRDNSETKKTYVEVIAQELNINYFPCDPSTAERLKRGIKERPQVARELGWEFVLIQPGSEEEKRVNDDPAIKEADAKREQYWLEKIIDHGGASKNILLVCGYEHPDSFIKLAKNRGYEAEKIVIH